MIAVGVFINISKNKIRKDDQVTWVSDYRKFGFVIRKIKSNMSIKKSNDDHIPFDIKKGQDIYELYNPHIIGNTTFIPISKVKDARRKI